MTAAIFNFTIEQGADFVLPLSCQDLTGESIDLTGCTAAMMIRVNYDDAEPLVSLTSEDGIDMDGSAGTMIIRIDSSVTSELPPGTAVYDLRLTDSLGHPLRLFQGNITISPAVTR